MLTSLLISFYNGASATCISHNIVLKRLARFWQNLRKQSKDRMIDSALQSKNRLVHVLTNAIVSITSMHNHMGNVAEYLVNPMCVQHG